MNTSLNKTMVGIKTNESGGAHAQGDVSVEDTTNPNSVVNDTSGAFVDGGVWVCIEPAGVADGALGRYANMGYVPKINLSASASLGDLVRTHTVAKQGVPHAAPMVAGDFAQVLGTGASPAAWLFGNAVQSSAPPTTQFLYDASSRAHTENNAWTDIENTEITFTAEKNKYHVNFTFTYKFARDGFWEILLVDLTGTNTGTISPPASTGWLVEYNEGDFNPGARMKTYQVSYVIQPTIGASVTVKARFHNSNTSNYISFFKTLLEVK